MPRNELTQDHVLDALRTVDDPNCTGIWFLSE